MEAGASSVGRWVGAVMGSEVAVGVGLGWEGAGREGLKEVCSPSLFLLSFFLMLDSEPVILRARVGRNVRCGRSALHYWNCF